MNNEEEKHKMYDEYLGYFFLEKRIHVTQQSDDVKKKVIAEIFGTIQRDPHEQPDIKSEDSEVEEQPKFIKQDSVEMVEQRLDGLKTAKDMYFKTQKEYDDQNKGFKANNEFQNIRFDYR